MTMRPTLVLGLGNPIMGDDGVGIAALERLRASWDFDDAVVLEDGGTWGMTLLPQIEDAGRVLFLDAINVGAAPGTGVRLEREALPKVLSMKVSPHQVDLREVLALTELRGTLPAETVALGIQPRDVELAVTLTPDVEAAMDALVDRAIGQLRAWGHACRPKEAAVGA